MNNLILLIFCFVAGMLLHRSRRMPESTPAVLNSYIINVALPALTLLHLHGLKLTSEVALLAAMGWVCFSLAAGFFWLMGRWLNLPRGTIGALILTGGLCNTAFFGLPMIEVFYGHEGIVTGLIVDQLGSALILSTLAMVVAGAYSSGHTTPGQMVRRILKFPPFIALVITFLLSPVAYPAWLSELLGRMGDTLAPLALLAVGFQLRLGHIAGNLRNLALGLGFKLILAPLALFILYVPLLGAHGQPIQVMLFQAAMPPMITSAVVASDHDLDPELATLMVAMGILLSFVTLGGWWWVLQGV
jgi:malate permease and related proteins